MAPHLPGPLAYASVPLWPGPAPGMPGVRSHPILPGHDPPLHADAPGSEVWAGGFSQDRLIQFGIGQQTLQPGVLLLQFSEPFGLIDLQAAIFLPPAEIRLIGNAHGWIGRAKYRW